MIRRMVDPFEALLAMQRSMDARRAGRGRPAAGAPVAFPGINVFRRGDDLVAVAELPGVRKDDLSVEVEGNQLRVAGRRAPVYGEQVTVHRRERRSGEFDRTLSLPVEIDAERVRAQFRDGNLAIILPRAERDRPKRVRIE